MCGQCLNSLQYPLKSKCLFPDDSSSYLRLHCYPFSTQCTKDTLSAEYIEDSREYKTIMQILQAYNLVGDEVGTG